MRQFMKVDEIAEEMGCSSGYVRQLANEMRDHIPDRYKLTDFFGSGKGLAIRFTAIQDYSLRREALRNGRPCPDFEPAIVERDLGISQTGGQMLVLTEENMKELARCIVSTFGARLGGANV